MADHVDKFSQLIEQILYHFKPAEKWTNIHTFFGTLDGEKWGAYEDGLDDTITTMFPTDPSQRISFQTVNCGAS